MLQKKLLGFILITLLVLFPRILVGQDRGAIRPMIYGEFDKVQLLPTGLWLMDGKPLSDIERELLQVSYLRGLYDGLQLANVGWPSVYTVFDGLAGMDLAQLREEINKLYKESAEMGKNPPALMVLEIVPGMRKAVPPAQEEKSKKEEVK